VYWKHERVNNSLPRQYTAQQFSPGWGDSNKTVSQQSTSPQKKHQHGQTVSFFSSAIVKELFLNTGVELLYCNRTLWKQVGEENTITIQHSLT